MTRQEEMRQEMNSQCSYYRERIGFRKGFEEADRTMIERACQWLKTAIYLDYENSIEHKYETMEELINDFKKAMQDERTNCKRLDG